DRLPGPGEHAQAARLGLSPPRALGDRRPLALDQFDVLLPQILETELAHPGTGSLGDAPAFVLVVEIVLEPFIEIGLVVEDALQAIAEVAADFPVLLFLEEK